MTNPSVEERPVTTGQALRMFQTVVPVLYAAHPEACERAKDLTQCLKLGGQYPDAEALKMLRDLLKPLTPISSYTGDESKIPQLVCCTITFFRFLNTGRLVWRSDDAEGRYADWVKAQPQP